MKRKEKTKKFNIKNKLREEEILKVKKISKFFIINQKYGEFLNFKRLEQINH